MRNKNINLNALTELFNYFVCSGCAPPSCNYFCHVMGVRDTLKIQKMKICLGTSQAETHNCMTKSARESNPDPYYGDWWTRSHPGGVYRWTFQTERCLAVPALRVLQDEESWDRYTAVDADSGDTVLSLSPSKTASTEWTRPRFFWLLAFNHRIEVYF